MLLPILFYLTTSPATLTGGGSVWKALVGIHTTRELVAATIVVEY